MSSSNLVVTTSAALPSATSTTLGGVLVDSTASGLLVMTDGHIAVKPDGNALKVDSGGHLTVIGAQNNFDVIDLASANYVGISTDSISGAFIGIHGTGGITFSDSTVQTTAFNAGSSILTGAISSAVANYLPLSGGTMTGTMSVINPSVSGSGMSIDGQYLSFNSGETGGIVFPDGSEQSIAYNPYAAYSLNGVTHNSDTLTTTSLSSGSTCYLTASANLQVVQLVSGSYIGTMPIVFPTPDADGYYFEIVMINGPGTYSVSGIGIDGSTPATIFFEFGSSSYEKGAFRYLTSTNTWYQVA
jgi:hypothetical protein